MSLAQRHIRMAAERQMEEDANQRAASSSAASSAVMLQPSSEAVAVMLQHMSCMTSTFCVFQQKHVEKQLQRKLSSWCVASDRLWGIRKIHRIAERWFFAYAQAKLPSSHTEWRFLIEKQVRRLLDEGESEKVQVIQEEAKQEIDLQGWSFLEGQRGHETFQQLQIRTNKARMLRHISAHGMGAISSPIQKVKYKVLQIIVSICGEQCL